MHVGDTLLREHPIGTERNTIALGPQVQAQGPSNAYRRLPYGEQEMVEACRAPRREDGGLTRAAPPQRNAG